MEQRGGHIWGGGGDRGVGGGWWDQAKNIFKNIKNRH